MVRPRARLVAALFLTTLCSEPAAALAQTMTRSGGAFVYAVSVSFGRRTTSGLFSAIDAPASAGQPPASLTTAGLTLEGGVTLTGRVALLAIADRTAALGTDTRGWGTQAYHAAIRVWATPRIWVEGGPGLADLAYRQPNVTPRVTTRWWAPGFEVAGGYEIFQGPTITLNAFARYQSVRIQGLRVNSVSFEVGLLGRTK